MEVAIEAVQLGSNVLMTRCGAHLDQYRQGSAFAGAAAAVCVVVLAVVVAGLVVLHVVVDAVISTGVILHVVASAVTVARLVLHVVARPVILRGLDLAGTVLLGGGRVGDVRGGLLVVGRGGRVRCRAGRIA
jgi:hypothetical protein